MSNFAIGILPFLKNESAIGFIKFGDEVEYMDCTIGHYSTEDYLRQWHEALMKISDDKVSRSAILQSFSDMDEFVEIWPMYKIGEKVIFRNQIATVKDIGSLDPNIWNIGPYSDDECSEWTVSISEIRDFITMFT